MKQIGMLIIIIFLLIQPVSADVFNDLEIKVNDYNEITDHIPSFISTIIGNEIIQLVIEMNDGTELHIKIITEDSIITTFEEIEADDDISATLLVGTTEDIVYELLESEDPLNDFIKAKDNEDIVIEPIGITNSVTFALVNVMLKLSKILGFI
jgi:hypothetical protein